MKRKIMLPLMVITISALSAFASQPFAQMGWYFVPPDSSAEGEIDNTTKLCATGRTTQCKIGTKDAYSSAVAAAAQNPAQLLKYN